MKKLLLATCCLITTILTYTQDDSAQLKILDEIVITATRTERKLGNVAVPVQLVSQKMIRQSGSVRLNDVLQEQTGLFVTSGGTTSSTGGGIFGNGVQIQGLSPDYTLILIDGEPVIGRQGGVIDLGRIAVGNIKKIEIVKGPSSSLYGSEAMGGVINIITEQPRAQQLDAGFRYSRFNTMDANISTGITGGKAALQIFGNRNSSDGFDLDQSLVGKTVDASNNYTGQLRFRYQYSLKTKLSLSARYYNEIQDNFFEVNDISTGSRINIIGDARIRDLGLNPVITHKFSEKIKSAIHFYFSRYEYEQKLIQESTKSDYYYDFFRQDFFRLENQTDINWLKNNYFTIGGGIVNEKLNTTRYAGKRTNSINYIFLQNEWRIKDHLILIGGLRFDDNSQYQSRLSPKLAAQYKVNEKLRFNASYGAGFKAPDFRQLFLNFLNSAAGGYVVYGANEITIAELEQQKQQGIITDILPKAYQLALLKPEISNGLNFGTHYIVNEKLNLALNLFRNNIKNLIQNDIIAFRQNGAPVYSYFNVKEAFTEGAELQAQYVLNRFIMMQGGYQFLMTGDKDDIEKINNGTVFTRDQHTNEVTKVRRSDYAGLSNRSAHMLNAKLFYENPKSHWGGSIRAIYRNRWGTYDKDGNNIINRDDEFAKGFLLLNFSVQRIIKNFRIQAGMDNMLNYKDVLNLPGQPGIQPYISISYSFIKNYQTL
jgi:outer membrane receptor for ferrienterochelin and colicins